MAEGFQLVIGPQHWVIEMSAACQTPPGLLYAASIISHLWQMGETSKSCTWEAAMNAQLKNVIEATHACAQFKLGT